MSTQLNEIDKLITKQATGDPFLIKRAKYDAVIKPDKATNVASAK